MKGTRTQKDFSKYNLLCIEEENRMVWKFFKKDEEDNPLFQGSFNFINTEGKLIITGDYGNWIFDRSFNPNVELSVSDGYWVKKLEQHSEQKGKVWCGDASLESIKSFLEQRLDWGTLNEEEDEWLKDLEQAAEENDELGYNYICYRQTPSSIEADEAPIGYKLNPHLAYCFDAFEAICKMLEEK